MLLSYLKIAWKVLLRRKFFTFISLFGISFTLMILLVVVAVVDHVVGPHAPEKRMDRMLFVNALRQQMSDGGNMTMPVSVHFIDRYVRTMKTPEMVALIAIAPSVTAFANNQGLKLDVRYTDANFWKITDFEFLDGRPFTAQEVQGADRVCVVNEHTARAFFGTSRGVTGRLVEIGSYRYHIAGVVPDVPATRFFSSSDVWLPYTLSGNYFRDNRLNGGFIPILLAPSTAAVPAVRQEFQRVMRQVEIPDPKAVKALFAYADPALASFTRVLTGTLEGENDGVGTFLLLCTVLGLLFMLLPALNLISLNVTRILERSGEIGVRKAFGATSGQLVGQFLVENIFLTLLGGLLGLALAAGALALLNGSHFIAYSHFGLNGRVFGAGLAAALFFGILSGAYPAYRMSKLPAIKALKGETNA